MKRLFNNSIKCAVNKANASINLSHSDWNGPSDTLVEQCVKDSYPWSERPVDINMAKKLMVQKFHEENQSL